MFHDYKMIRFFPLSPNKIVLFEVFSFFILHNFSFRCAVEIPPPSALFKKLMNELCVVSPTHEAIIMLKFLSLEICIEVIRLVNHFVKL